MSFSRILYMICVNGGYLMSEIFINIDRKTGREIKETLQWPPMENELVVYTQHGPVPPESLQQSPHRPRCVGSFLTGATEVVFRLLRRVGLNCVRQSKQMYTGYIAFTAALIGQR